MKDGLPLRKLPMEGTIDVWLIDLDRPLGSEVKLDNILSGEERNRAERFIFSRYASRFRLCRAMLRLGLAGYLQQNPQEIVLTANCHGKPRLDANSALHFNVTHSDGLGAIAFTTAGEVGIDVEAYQRDVEALDIANANFTRNEAAMIAEALSPQEQVRIFLRLWTRKEAVLKAAGCGIPYGLDKVDVSQLSVNLVRLIGARSEIPGPCWRVQDLESIDGFAGAIAAPAGDWSILQRAVSYEDVIDGFAGKFAGLL
ncbi:MAG: 4'-phosphopantetheinyl transferase superfamily protein [Terracidiphilus sp.]|jgi:4'-phosphopantetheinyl transferase